MRHLPVLVDEVVEALKVREGMVVVDCTVGLGGHSLEILRRIGPAGRLIGMDLDKANVERASEKLSGGNVVLRQGNFAGVPKVLAEESIEKVDGLLADLGVASPQIDDPSRGFSYREDGPLDMRMDNSRGETAAAVVNRKGEEELAKLLMDLGDEEDSFEIAKLIVERRAKKRIERTGELMEIICEAREFKLKRAAGAKLHPAARTFQALRMIVNRELANLQRLLAVIPQVVRSGGRAAIISFHSGEDRLVKRAFKEGLEMGVYSEIAREPVVASEEETRRNSRSRSAKLRWAEVR
ncbi:MAG TPA: 16S rRNA (cytosine(1402)-N(4))-methyltransferase RsmH [Tepidisphaeraceae bacterium]|nr:16S rRNA (cytosine(1402)-N(4))-methyltransferase RsmH [Tepidisphaeraceae bacterium]